VADEASAQVWTFGRPTRRSVALAGNGVDAIEFYFVGRSPRCGPRPWTL